LRTYNGNGTIENVNTITLQAALDLTAACVQLQNTATITNHSMIYGNGETLPGVYSEQLHPLMGL
jgi:hypothetical protein